MYKQILIAVIAFVVIGGVLWQKEALAPLAPPEASIAEIPTGIEYRNTTYGFRIALPLDWQGYSVSIDTWTGNAAGDILGDTAYTEGPVISIHHPKWTPAKPYQDIPIMVFTLLQWNELDQGNFHIGAAPIEPTELGRNGAYVLALPARYNYAFPPGYEEVEQILQSKPLTTF